MHRDRRYLQSLVPLLRHFLAKNLALRLHPKKLYLQSADHGVQFLGCYIKPTHVVVTRRVRRNFVHRMAAYAVYGGAVGTVF